MKNPFYHTFYGRQRHRTPARTRASLRSIEVRVPRGPAELCTDDPLQSSPLKLSQPRRCPLWLSALADSPPAPIAPSSILDSPSPRQRHSIFKPSCPHHLSFAFWRQGPNCRPSSLCRQAPVDKERRDPLVASTNIFLPRRSAATGSWVERLSRSAPGPVARASDVSPEQ